MAELGEFVDWLTDAGMAADTTTLAILSVARRRISLARAVGVSTAKPTSRSPAIQRASTLTDTARNANVRMSELGVP